MKTEFEKMRGGEMYDYSDPEVDESLRRSRLACEQLNRTGLDHVDYRAALENLIPGVPESVIIVPPFHCDHGHGLRLGEHVFINYNAILLDTAHITIGAHTLLGPNVSIYTCNHPLDWRLRRKTVERAQPVIIGSDCWLGGNVVVRPGVSIGDRCVIGTGSVVVHDIPAGSLAAGNPCRVIRKLEDEMQ